MHLPLSMLELGHDPDAFSAALERRLHPVMPRAEPRRERPAAYLCTNRTDGLTALRAGALTYRFPNVYILGPSYACNDETLPGDSLPWWQHGATNVHRSFRTSQLAQAWGLSLDWDLPAKRTFALRHAREAGHEAALLVDDDIWPISTADVALFQQVKNGLMGKPPVSAADCSAVEDWCSAEGSNHRFLNGNYLFFDPKADLAFFPQVYNEDWLFVLASPDATPALAASEALFQAARCYCAEERASQQEFGETLVKGYVLGQSLVGGTGYWEQVLQDRGKYLRGRQANQRDAKRRAIIDRALEAHAKIAADQLKEWSLAFAADLTDWRAQGTGTP